MKNILTLLSLITFAFLTIGCEDPVNVDLNTAPPKLVIDASIKWQKGTLGNEQTIKLTTTTGYYSSTIPKVSGATVMVTNNNTSAVFNFVEVIGTGEYECHDFIPIIDDNYTLTVNYKGQNYTATEKLYATPEIDAIEQKLMPGFGGENTIQVKFFYQDNGTQDNFYLIGFKNNKVAFPEYGVVSDEFFQGNQMFGFYTNEDLKPTHKLDLSLQGISERHYNYMSKLLNIAGTTVGNPFSATPTILKGNIINQTNQENFPLGYFNLSELDTENYIVH